MRKFVLCRKSPEWSDLAIYNLVELFLNPNNEVVGGEALQYSADSSQSKDDFQTLMTADQLLKDINFPKSLCIQVLECKVTFASKQKGEIEKGINSLLKILNEFNDYIPALHAVSVGYLLLKQAPRARNMLKRAVKFDWNQEFGVEIENCWLLLADLYIQAGKYDLALELLKKVTAVNKSCSKAWEYIGFIMEKEASFKNATENYLECWKLSREQNASIGYKLAFNYLKSKLFVEAIDISHKILGNNPDYPKIQKEILEKARSSLRV
jgi:tetratricopeptide (TPR) repeat protein